jgi:chaperonin GroEL
MTVKKRKVLFQEQLESKIKKGVDTLADAVKTTMGPKGKLVLIQKGQEHPIVTKDGVTVANAVNLADEVENLGVRVLKEAASRTAEEAGDGTTTATVLAQSIFSEGLKMKSAGFQTDLIKRGIEEATLTVKKSLDSQKREIKDRNELKQVAIISANGEEEISDLIVRAIESAGPDGSIIVEEAKGFNSSLTVVEGYRLERGFLSPYFVTDKNRVVTEFQNPLILLADREFSVVRDMMGILELALESGRPLLIVANNVDGDALQGLVLNRIKGSLRVCAIRSPGFGASRYEQLLDLQAVVGGTVINDTTDLANFDMSDFGTIKKAIVGKSSSMLISADGKKSVKINERILGIKENLRNPENEGPEVELLNYRLQQLSGGVAILRVGAATESELIERYDRVDDALNATKAALQEGILPGGGVALVRAQKVLLSRINKEKNDDVRSGMSIVAKSITEPFKQIIRNGTNSPEALLEEILRSKATVGYDARNESMGDMFKIGIVDPHKVVRCAIENASSAAVMLLSVGCCLIDIENETFEVDN